MRQIIKGLSQDEVAIICANPGHFIKAVVDTRNNMTHAAVHDAILERLFDEYPGIREQFEGAFGKEERKRVLPRIRFPGQLDEVMRLEEFGSADNSRLLIRERSASMAD